MSSRRPRRKCAKTTYVSTIPDEYLVGYVEDGENIDMIMKKFEVLEQLEKEGPIKGEQREGEQVLTEEQLKDVFRLTSNFTAESVLDDDASRSDLDFYYDYFVSEEACGEDYFAEDEIWDEDVDDDDLDFFPTDGRKRKRMSRSTGQQPSYGGNKFISCEVTGEDGFLYTVRKKVRNVDPNLPTYTRIPPEPIPLSWAKRVQPFRPPQSGDDLQNNIHLFRSASEVLSADLAKLGRFQGLLIDPPWQLPNEPRDPNRITPEQFSKLKITDKVIPKGLIFIWAPKELIAQTLKTMGRWGFLYVENLVWVKKAVNNKTVAQPYKYFSRAKESLLIFRKFCAAASANQQNHHSSRSSGSQKEWQLELRHQRNPDVVFDFVKPKKHSSALGEEEKPEFVYHVIETLLPEANYDLKTGRGMFLELWGKPSSCRKGWTVVSIQPDQAD